MIFDHHRQEWLDSGVSEQIIERNVQSIEDPAEVDKLLSRNTETRWKHSEALVPGWGVSGVDPQTGEPTLLGAQFKPDKPPTDQNGKAQKYLSASGYPAEPLFLDTGEPDYWLKVISDPSVPVLTTEGAKKAGSALTQGYACISLPGVACGQKDERLRESLKLFSVIGRKVYLAFDSDQMTNPNVCQALDILGRLISAAGAVVCVLQWDVRWKGLDDYLTADPSHSIKQLIDQALTFAEWREKIPKPEQRIPQTDEIRKELGGLTEIQALKCPPVLPERLLAPMRKLASRLNVPVEAYVASLLAVASSQIASETRLELDPATDFYAPPVFWLGIVGETGSKKSPILRAVTSPLDHLQQAAEEEYEILLEEYESKVESWEAQEKGKRGPRPKPPSPKEFYLSDFTMESLAGVLETQSERGMLVSIDELTRFFSSMDAYRNGKGGDRQTWLSLYDGGHLKVNRKGGGRVYADKTSVSVLGGIQPAIIQKIMSGDASQEDGLWSRFSWIRIPLSISEGISQGEACDLSKLLEELYKGLSGLSAATYRLESEAISIWNKWHGEIDQLILKEASSILRATYPKARERAARLALVIHLIDAVMEKKDLTDMEKKDLTGMEKKDPTETIPAATLEKAIEFTRWLMAQTRLMYAEFGIVDNPEAAKILKFVNRFHGCGWVTAKQVTHWHSSKDKPTADKARGFMKQVVALGYATDNGKEGSAYQIEIISSFGNSGNQTPLAPTGQGSEAVTTPGNPVVTPVTEPQPDSLKQSISQSRAELPGELPGYHSVTDAGNSLNPSQDNLSSSLVTELPQNRSNQKCDESFQVGDQVRYSGNGHLGRVCLDKTLALLSIG